MPTLYPCLRYADAPSAIDWLERAFGFERLLVVPGPGGTVRHAELRLGDGVIMLGSARDDGYGRSPRDLGAVSGTIYAAIADVDAHFARAKAAGAEILREPSDTDYGAREYGCRDLEGHVWSFGTYSPK